MSGGDEAQSNPGGPEDQGVEWYLARDGKQYGPLSDTEMMKLVEFGHLKSADLVWRAGFADCGHCWPTHGDGRAARPPQFS